MRWLHYRRGSPNPYFIECAPHKPLRCRLESPWCRSLSLGDRDPHPGGKSRLCGRPSWWSGERSDGSRSAVSDSPPVSLNSWSNGFVSHFWKSGLGAWTGDLPLASSCPPRFLVSGFIFTFKEVRFNHDFRDFVCIDLHFNSLVNLIQFLKNCAL